MSDIARPFLRLWNYIENVGGFPGQILFIVSIIMLIVGFFTWFGNKK